MQTYKITKIDRFFKDKNNNQFTGKYGPQMRVVLELEGIEGRPSFFCKSGAYAHLKEGSEIVGRVFTNDKGYVNFEIDQEANTSSAPRTGSPAPTAVDLSEVLSRLDALSTRFDRLAEWVKTEANITDLPF